MSFGGGGGGSLPNHEHTNIALDGGPLDFLNTTVASMLAGSITYSNGTALQGLPLAAGSIAYSNGTDILELPIGGEGDSLIVSSGVPIWDDGIYQWDQTTGGQTIGMQLGSQEAIQEFQTGFEIIGYKITKVEWSVRRNIGTGANLAFRCEIIDSGCAIKDTIGSDYDASTVGAVFEYIPFTGSATNYAITNTDIMRLKLVDTGGGSGADQFSAELCASCIIANTRGGSDSGACVQSWYASRNSTVKVTYEKL